MPSAFRIVSHGSRSSGRPARASTKAQESKASGRTPRDSTIYRRMDFALKPENTAILRSAAGHDVAGVLRDDELDAILRDFPEP